MVANDSKMRNGQRVVRRSLALLPVFLLAASWNPAFCLCANSILQLGQCGQSNQSTESLQPAADHCHMAGNEAEPDCHESGSSSQTLASAANSATALLDCCNKHSGIVSTAGFVSYVPLNLEAQPDSFQPESERILPSTEVFRPPRSRPIYLSVSSFLI